MLNIIKYSAFIAAGAGLLLGASCKAKKRAVEVPAEAPDNIPQGVYPEGWFGSLYVDGCAQRMKGNLREALRLFTDCQKLKPGNAAVHYELGTVHKLLGNTTEAVNHARLCAEAQPGNEWYQLLLIDAYKSAGAFGNAVKVREALVKRYPARSDFREDLAIDYAMTGQYEKALRAYEQLEKEFGVSEQLTVNKVRLLHEMRRNGDVEKELVKLVESDRNEVRYLERLSDFYVERGDHEKARPVYDKILSLDPMNATVHLALHDYYSRKGGKKEAQEHLRKAFLNPDLDIGTKAGIVGDFYRRAQANDSAASVAGKDLAAIMLQVHPGAPESNALYADFLLLENDRGAAVTYYRVAARAEKNDGRVWENLLHIESDLKLFDSVEVHSRMALDKFPNIGRLYLYNGHANMQKGQHGTAAQSLRDGLEFTAGDINLRIEMLRLLGDVYHRLKEYARSDEAFEEVLRHQPDNAYVLNNYAYYLSQRDHNLQHAARLSKQSLDLHPANRNYMDTYGWILYRQGRYAEAAEWLSKASTGSANPTILEHYGDALFRLGRIDEAVNAWEAARKAGNTSAELQQKILEKKIYDR